MKIIFLDIDGVLNNHGWLSKRHDFKSFCPENIAELNRVTYATGAKIVISSNWRLYPYNLPDLFKKQGIAGEIVGETPKLNENRNGILWAVIRGDEIAAWLNDNPAPDSYVIIDDDGDMGILARRLVRTDPANGITRCNADTAISMLQEANR